MVQHHTIGLLLYRGLCTAFTTMNELRALTPEEFAKAEFRLRNPAPGSRIETAKHHGIDLTLLIDQLRLHPSERARRMHLLAQTAEKVRKTISVR